MKKDQQSYIDEARVLLTSANEGNPIHWELGKYIYRQGSSLKHGMERGWFNGASADDMEYINAHFDLIKEFEDMYSDYRTDNNEIIPDICFELNEDLLEQYDYSTVLGISILKSFEHIYSLGCNDWQRTYGDQAQVAENDRMLKKVREKLPKNMKPQE